MKNRKNVALINWLDDRGYGIFVNIQADGSDGEYILARAIVEDGLVYAFDEIMTSKFKAKCMNRYLHEVVTNKDLIMDIRETLKGLTRKQLRSLLPSYYQLAIEARIKELENAAKTKRERKTVIKTTN